MTRRCESYASQRAETRIAQRVHYNNRSNLGQEYKIPIIRVYMNLSRMLEYSSRRRRLSLYLSLFLHLTNAELLKRLRYPIAKQKDLHCALRPTSDGILNGIQFVSACLPSSFYPFSPLYFISRLLELSTFCKSSSLQWIQVSRLIPLFLSLSHPLFGLFVRLTKFASTKFARWQTSHRCSLPVDKRALYTYTYIEGGQLVQRAFHYVHSVYIQSLPLFLSLSTFLFTAWFIYWDNTLLGHIDNICICTGLYNKEDDLDRPYIQWSFDFQLMPMTSFVDSAFIVFYYEEKLKIIYLYKIKMLSLQFTLGPRAAWQQLILDSKGFWLKKLFRKSIL